MIAPASDLHPVTIYPASGIGYTGRMTGPERRLRMIIRQRSSKLDDGAIMQLIDTQLVPLSHMSEKEIHKIRKEIPLRMNRGMTFVISPEPDKSAVAFIHFLMHGELLYVDMMAVSSKEQRKRYGQTLLYKAESFAVSRGCRKSKVMVDEGNTKGIQFYQKNGYQTLRYILVSRCYEMEKRL
jgi:ribosomal protein S18 acetylase RimI-like enzyme